MEIQNSFHFRLAEELNQWFRILLWAYSVENVEKDSKLWYIINRKLFI